MQSLRASELLPPGFSAVDALSDGNSTVIAIRATGANSPCPSCGAISDRVHSRYPRRLADLPIAGLRVVLVLHARRFRCDAVRCARRIFTERFDDNILKPWSRRTGCSRGLTRKVLRGQRSDIFRVRGSSLEAYLPWLDEQ